MVAKRRIPIKRGPSRLTAQSDPDIARLRREIDEEIRRLRNARVADIADFCEGVEDCMNEILVAGDGIEISEGSIIIATDLAAGAGISLTGTHPITIAATGLAANTPSFVTTAAEATLPNERVLTAGTGITVTDNGAGTTVTIATTITQYTDEMARDAIGAALVESTGIDIVVSDAGDTITISSTITQYTDEMARDAIGAALVEGAGIDITVNDAGDTITIAATGGGGGAPAAAQYVVLATDAGLSDERVLTAGHGIDLVDAGAGSTITIDVDETELDIQAPQYVTLAATSALPNERVLTAGHGIDLVDAGAGSTITIDVDETELSFVTRIAGNSGAAGPYLTLQILTANATRTATALATVMSTTGVGAGLWRFKYTLRFQSNTANTGLHLAINHTGTVTTMEWMSRFVSSGGAAATGIHDDVAATNAGQLVEGKSTNVLNASPSATAGVITINSTSLVVLEGLVRVTASGTLELRYASEVAATQVSLLADSTLELTQVA